MTRIAPGPGLAVVTQLRALRRDPLGFMLRVHERWGDIVRLGAGRAAVHLVGHCEAAEELLTLKNMKYDRATRSARAVGDVTGESILTTSGDAWRRRRLLMQPTFNSGSVRGLAPVIVDNTAKLLSKWKRGALLDAAAEMQHLAFCIAGEAFFGADLAEKSATVERLVPVILQETYRRATDVVPTQWIRRSAARRFDAAMREVDSIVREVLAGGGKSLAAALLAADEEGERKLTPDEVRNETIALLLAGHETTANALSWALYLLGRDAAAMRKVREEVLAVLGDRVPAPEDLKQLPSVTSAFLETLRLYPPIWIVERRAAVDDEVGGYAIEQGSIVYVSPWVLHRDRRFWDAPGTPDLLRFAANPHERRPSFLPFGMGPHHCLGSHFAMLEAQLILAMILQHFEVHAASTREVEPEPWITLRPRGAVTLRIE